jgi:ABC-type glycerol-3-phosphate transport system substrate-binding protein
VACEFDNRVVNAPVIDASQGNFIAFVPNSFGISTTSNNPAAAFDLLAFMTTDEAIGMLTEGANITPAVSTPTADAFFAPQSDRFPFDFYQITAPTPDSTFYIAPDGGWWFSVYNTMHTRWVSFYMARRDGTPQLTAEQLANEMTQAYNDWKASR